MNAREKEYKEIFIAEALELYDGLSTHIIDLEKDPENDRTLAEIFRLLHNLKANAKAIGYEGIGDVAHKLENAFSAIRNHELKFQDKVVSILVDGIDMLGALIANIDKPEFLPEPDLLQTIDQLTAGALHEIEHFPVKRYYTSQNISLSDLIYIQIRKLDDLLNLVGELIIDRDRITSISNNTDNESLKSVASHLYRITSDIQNSVMDARLVNVGSLFNKFPRIVRDLSVMDDKKVELTISGQDIKIDRNILQIITDSLLHLVRNAVSHGIEPKEQRLKLKKPAEGHIYLSAYSEKDEVIIEVQDDGKGIDIGHVRKYAVANNYISADKIDELNTIETLSLIFEPGFSLAKNVTELSGRGVGLDVVKNALDSIGGKISVDSKKDEGTTFTLSLPTSIAVKGALLFEVEKTSYAIPLIHTDSVLTIGRKALHQVGLSIVADVKNENLPVVDLQHLFKSLDFSDAGSVKMLRGDVQQVIVVSYNNRKLGLIVDKLLRQQDIVVKPLQRPVDEIDIFGGVTLLGSGEVCLVLDIPNIARKLITKK
jgi:two-component system chemotaxis sensor kinase CheA